VVLLKLGSAQAGKISKETQINRTSIYDSLERLIERGLVTYIIEANRKTFRAVSPDAILNQLKEKQKIAEEILPELNKLTKSSKEKEESDIYKGRKGIRSILFDILNYKEYIAFGSSGRFLEIMKHDFILFQKRKKELKINAKVILSESSRKTEQVKLSHTNFKYIPDEFSSPTTTFVYDDKTAIIVWGEIPIATLITSKEVSNSYRKYFDFLWKQAKK
jgi:sugar-specific transcriptional regulator TrmB